MTPKASILVIDDHPITITGYKTCLEDSGLSLHIDGACNCDEAINKLNNTKSNFFKMVFLDIKLPSSKTSKITGGEDLGLFIRKQFPETKIIVHTSLRDEQRITNIIKSLSPEGFLIKSDLSIKILSDSVITVLEGNKYYSDSVRNLSKQSTSYDDFFVDSLDMQIIYFLSKGELTKNLPRLVPLSMATIERRKKRLKTVFGIPYGSDKQLLDVAREKGYIL
ncbi:response regulator [Maribacter flavus]|uniref:response regulator n=1 Tax=Maribacter flavus TaxID=1658664 RepID=UPI0013759133|nr:response regulator [Maribacter flavus]